MALWPAHGIAALAALLLSVLIHLMLFAMWPVFAFMGKPAAQLRVSLREMATPAPGTGTVEKVLPVLGKLADGQKLVAPVLARPERSVASSVPGADQSGEMHSAGARAEDYIPVELLDERPVFLRDLADYAPTLDDSEHGEVVMQLLISATGEVDDVILESSELSADATRRFLQQLGAARLTPGMREAKSVKSRWRMEFTFDPVSPTHH